MRKAAERMNGTVGVESTGKEGVNFGFSYTGSAAKMKSGVKTLKQNGTILLVAGRSG